MDIVKSNGSSVLVVDIPLQGFVMRSFHLISFLLVLIYFPLPSASHCCHKCIWQEISFRDSKYPGFQIPYPDNIRGCSLGCDGDVMKDGTCTPGGFQVLFMNNCPQTFPQGYLKL